jgi:4'-phosphopantetheinyl transferase
MLGLLSCDERQRAERFRFAGDQARYIVGRALLRKLLARYLDAAPEQLEFQYGPFQKPMLSARLWFNLSHSGSVALYGFSSAGELGIDVELERVDFARERIAERFFSASEVQVLRALPAEMRSRAFLCCWTRKEAFIKARGDGLSLALDSFDVSFAPGAPAALLRTDWCSGEAAQWCLEDLSDARAGYIAAVAMRGGPRKICDRQLMEDTHGQRALRGPQVITTSTGSGP